MLTPSQALERAQSLVQAAVKAGASAADAVYICNAATQVGIRLGELEDVERSEGESIGLRYFNGARSATISSSDLSADALATLVERAGHMAAAAPEDRYEGLAEEELLLKDEPPMLDIDDGGAADPQLLRDMAFRAEQAARGADGITNSEGSGASAARSAVALATSHGFAGSYSGTAYSVSAAVLAGSGNDMQRDYATHSARHLADLEGVEDIGARAAERTVARMNPVTIKSGAMPVVYDPRVGSSLVGHLLGAISGMAIARKTSFLLGALDTQLFDSSVTLIDDPHLARGLRSRGFDGEGLPTAASRIIDEGRLTTWLLNTASARQLGLVPNGHATRGTSGSPGIGAGNLHLAPGRDSPAALMADIAEGVYITELIGMGVNGVTGDYSRGASGFLIQGGEIGPAVSGITIAGNLKDMFAAMVPADDLSMRRAVNVPTLRIDGMTVAGD